MTTFRAKLKLGYTEYSGNLYVFCPVMPKSLPDGGYFYKFKDDKRLIEIYSEKHDSENSAIMDAKSNGIEILFDKSLD